MAQYENERDARGRAVCARNRQREGEGEQLEAAGATGGARTSRTTETRCTTVAMPNLSRWRAQRGGVGAVSTAPREGHRRAAGTPHRLAASAESRGVRPIEASKPKDPKKPKKPKKGEQLSLPRTGGWGGKRRGAGRKPSNPDARSRVSHAKRPVHKGRHPVHVTLRAKTGLPSLRQQRVQRILADVLRDQRKRRYKDHFRVNHYSIQGNHLHLIVEADTESAPGYDPLRAGVSGFAIALGRRLNFLLGRKGKVWVDRYHRHDLATPKETWNALSYVFGNYTHHGVRSFGEGVLDLYASGCVFDGWDGPHYVPDESDRWRFPVCPAETWLLRHGYRVHGPLTITPTG